MLYRRCPLLWNLSFSAPCLKTVSYTTLTVCLDWDILHVSPTDSVRNHLADLIVLGGGKLVRKTDYIKMSRSQVHACNICTNVLTRTAQYM